MADSKWNFDVIFEGDYKAQACKVAHFKDGLKRLAHEASKAYAATVLEGRVSQAQTLAKIHEYEEAGETLQNDQRFKRLVKAVRAEQEIAAKDDVRDMLLKSIEDVFGPRPEDIGKAPDAQYEGTKQRDPHQF